VADWRTNARPRLERALKARDMAGHTRILIDLVMFTSDSAAVEALAREVLASQDHDTQEWWNGECNCDGHQN
jgi:hypothetical protein